MLFRSAIKEKYATQNVAIPDIRLLKYPNAEPVVSPYTGSVIWELDFVEVSKEPVHGRLYKESEHMCTIQTKYGLEHISSFCTGRIVGVEKKQGETVRKGDIIAYIQQQ